MKKSIVFITLFLGAFLYGSIRGSAQEYKLHQVMRMKDQKTESLLYVKGKRQRVESWMAGPAGGFVVIEQCDLRRTITLNDKKKLYYIQPYSEAESRPVKPANEPLPPKEPREMKKGGVITIWSSIRDTGERKKMFGFTARHLWTSQKLKPSADACSMKDSMLRKTDGWYVDLPAFECKTNRAIAQGGYGDGGPRCEDKYVMHESGKGKLGFPLLETTTIIMGDGSDTYETKIETLELSTAKLDTMLFTIPPGYQLVNQLQDLFDRNDIGTMMNEAMQNQEGQVSGVNKEAKTPGHIRIGVFAPSGSADVQAGELQQYLVRTINSQSLEAIPISSNEEAQKYFCDYTLHTEFTTIKSESTVGGVVRAIRKRDPNLSSTYNIQGVLTLQTVKDGTEKNRQTIDGKYEGKIDDAASRALDKACLQVLKGLR